MYYRHSIDHCFQYGVTRARIEELCVRLEPAVKALVTRANKGAAPLLDAALKDDLGELETLATELRATYKTVIVAGTGGSGLSGRTLTQLKLLGAAHIHYLENIDPDTLEDMLAHIDLKQTCFLVISKSGSTVETLSQYYVLLNHVEKTLGREGVRGRFILITTPGENPMRASARKYQLRVLDHAPDVGGRFAILTLVGLLPAAIAGLDIRAIRKGAQSVLAQLHDAKHPSESYPALGAALQYAFMEKKIPMSVMLPYAEKLTVFSLWHRQVWAESLGKKGHGTTPIPSVGTTDQHSQVQLYLDGPKDKLFTMVVSNRKGKGPVIHAPDDKSLDYIRGKTMGDVMAAEQKATFETLVKAGRPVREIEIDAIAEEQMGALLMHFTIEVILTADLLGINPFDQPAVEDGKILARDYLLSGML